MDLKIRLRSSGRVLPDVLSIASSTNLRDLCAFLRVHARTLALLETDDQQVRFLCGFPPKVLEESSEDLATTVLGATEIVTLDFASTRVKGPHLEQRNTGKKRRRDASSEDGDFVDVVEKDVGASMHTTRLYRAAKANARVYITSQIAEDEAKQKEAKAKGKEAAAARASTGTFSGSAAKKTPAKRIRMPGEGNVLGHDKSWEGGVGVGDAHDSSFPQKSPSQGLLAGYCTATSPPPVLHAPAGSSASTPNALLAHLREQRLANRSEERAAEVTSAASVARSRVRRARKSRGVSQFSLDQEGLTAALAASGWGSGVDVKGNATLETLRAVSQHALKGQYNEADANARLAAALGGQYDITLELGSAPAVQLRVRYKYPGKREWVTETVDSFPGMALPAMLQLLAIRAAGPAEKEDLKPYSLARSAKTFWAIVRFGGAKLRGKAAAASPGIAPLCWMADVPVTAGQPVDIVSALTTLQPNVPWSSFVNERLKTLSEKGQILAAERAVKSAVQVARTRKRLGLPPLTAHAHADDAGTLVPVENADEVVEIDIDGDIGASDDILGGSGSGKASPVEGPCIVALDAACVTAAAMYLQSDAGLSMLARIQTHRQASLVSSQWAQATLSRLASALKIPDNSTVDVMLEQIDSVPVHTLPDRLVEGVAGQAYQELTEQVMLVCDRCGKCRILSPDELGKEVLASEGEWTCNGSGLSSLLSRGGCEAPDDEISKALGSSITSGQLARFGLTSLSALTSSFLRDAEDILYAGPERPLQPVLVESTHGACTSQGWDGVADHQSTSLICTSSSAAATQSSSAAARISLVEWPEALRSRLPPPIAVQAILEAEAGAVQQTKMISLPPPLEDAIKTGKLRVFQTKEAQLPHLARGFALIRAAAGALIGQTPSSASSSAAWSAEDAADAAESVLQTPLGTACALRLASSWRDAVRTYVLEEELDACVEAPFKVLRMAVDNAVDGYVGGVAGEGDVDPRVARLIPSVGGQDEFEEEEERVGDRVQVVLDEVYDYAITTLSKIIGIQTPGDLLRFQGDEQGLLNVLLCGADRAHGSTPPSAAWLAVSDVHAWMDAARAAVGREPWIGTVVTHNA